MRNLRSSIDDSGENVGYAVNEEEIPLVPLRRSESTHDNSSNKKTRVASHLDDDDNEDDDVEGWELDDFSSNTSRDNLTEAADYDLATASRNGRVRLQDEEKDAAKSKDDDDDPALAMVKAVVPETDDPSLPNLTFRVFVLGSILCGVGAAISQLFFVSLNLSCATKHSALPNRHKRHVQSHPIYYAHMGMQGATLRLSSKEFHCETYKELLTGNLFAQHLCSRPVEQFKSK